MLHLRHCHLAASALLAALALLPGCASIGPGRMLQDRADYNSSLTESWKRQILLNIVKVRYVEPLFFMDVGDIVAGYTMETAGSMGFTRSLFDVTPSTDSPVFSSSSKLDFGLSGKYTDRPTITYKPMTGAPFRKGIMSPIPLHNILLGLESGVSAHFLCNLGVRAINGQRNAILTPQREAPAQEGFSRAVELLAQLQVANGLHVRVEPRPQGKDVRLFLSLGGKNPAPDVLALVKELQNLLDLDQSVFVYEVVSVPEANNRRQITVQTYSLMQIMATIATRVAIPETDIQEQCALPGTSLNLNHGPIAGMTIHTAQTKPKESYAAVHYHGHWFWVDDRDLTTKRVFSFLMLAFTLMEDKVATPPVQLTIPTQ